MALHGFMACDRWPCQTYMSPDQHFSCGARRPALPWHRTPPWAQHTILPSTRAQRAAVPVTDGRTPLLMTAVDDRRVEPAYPAFSTTPTDDDRPAVPARPLDPAPRPHPPPSPGGLQLRLLCFPTPTKHHHFTTLPCHQGVRQATSDPHHHTRPCHFPWRRLVIPTSMSQCSAIPTTPGQQSSCARHRQ